MQQDFEIKNHDQCMISRLLLNNINRFSVSVCHAVEVYTEAVLEHEDYFYYWTWD